ncbi:hypothetical protein MPLDJ20_110271 [Mesorhizobium plurifarium]|uniref:Uncharacterized protein n=1 Tax=Mesorhizobium plurifarium TaxID=69974 RepID=A0A090DZC6_MESPL|nr:hypothetical protein MPLDJ20_110271 [Mesorhizobium plurifarium]
MHQPFGGVGFISRQYGNLHGTLLLMSLPRPPNDVGSTDVPVLSWHLTGLLVDRSGAVLANGRFNRSEAPVYCNMRYF